MATASKKGDLIELDDRLKKCRGMMELSTSTLERAVLMAQGMQVAKKYVASNIETLAPLADSELGFLTDRTTGKKQPYSNTELVAPIVTALMRGVPLVGNCFNVMSGRCYVTTQGYDYLFAIRDGCDVPTVKIGNVEITHEPRWDKERDRGIPGTARVAAIGEVIANGKLYRVTFLETAELDERIAVKYNANMAEDAIVGKARARVLKSLWRLVSNAVLDDPDEPDDATIIDAPSVPLPTTEDPNEGGIDPIAEAKEVYLEALDVADASLSVQAATDAYTEFERTVALTGSCHIPWAAAERESTIKKINERRRQS